MLLRSAASPLVALSLTPLALAFAGASPGTQAVGSGQPAQPGQASAQDGATIHLAERLDGARIASPLLGLEAAKDVDDLEDPALDVLLEVGFDDFDFEYEGWPQISFGGVHEEDGDPVLRLERLGDENLGWFLPVRTDSFYRFERRVRVEGTPFCDFYVVESRLDVEQAQLNSRAHFLAGRGEALKVHSLELDSGADLEDTWQHASTSFYPTPRTRSLVVLIRRRVGADPGATVNSMSFDDVRLEEVLPSNEERMQLLKGAHAAEGADPSRGMRKAGLLLPLPTAQGRLPGEAAESNYTWRKALYAPPTTEIAFDLTLPPNARLRLATGLAQETPPGAAARFQVTLTPRAGGEPEQLVDVVRTASMSEWEWQDLDVDLSAWAGREGTLVLRSLAEKGDPHPLWGNPRIESAGDSSDPLVILIAVDTLRADRLSAYGYEASSSPALEQLAADGVLFDQARSNCNWTCPSFASIFTGLVPSRHGVSSYGPATPLPDELVTLAEHFQNQGFATRSIAYKVPLFDGNYEQGFDQAFNIPRDFIRGEENVARALEWLETHRGGSSFLFLHFNDPHQPFIQPEPFDHGHELPMGVPAAENTEECQRFSDLYDGAVSYVDACIGSFLDALRERGLYDKATIAFVADHGEQLWEHGRFGHGGDHLYDEIVRVPLIVKPPADAFPAGRVVAAEVSGFDVMPTVLELGGVQPPAGLDARSLVPLIEGSMERLDRVVVTETSQRGLALVDGGYKFVLEPGGSEESLFHYAADPLELEDVAEREPAQLARLRALAISYLLEHRPGNYVLVRSGATPATLELSTRSVRPLVGPSLRIEPLGQDGSIVTLASESWALLELEGQSAESAVVRGLELHGPPTGFGPWIKGSLASLKGPGLWRITGPEHRGPVEASLAPVDAELLEALKRLGYAE